MAEAERQVNERIALVMGWTPTNVTKNEARWLDPNGCERWLLPDYFHDSVAATALWLWLTAAGFDCDVCNEIQSLPEERFSCEITHRKYPGLGKIRDGSSWTTALTLAADAAIKETANDK